MSQMIQPTVPSDRSTNEKVIRVVFHKNCRKLQKIPKQVYMFLVLCYYLPYNITWLSFEDICSIEIIYTISHLVITKSALSKKSWSQGVPWLPMLLQNYHWTKRKWMLQTNKQKTKKSILGLSTFFEYCLVSFLIILFSVLWTLTLTFEQSLKLFTSYSCDWQTDWQTDRKLQYIGHQLYGSKKWFISKIDFVISTDLLFSYMEIIIIINFKNITYLSL